jgi:hypothetical protein
MDRRPEDGRQIQRGQAEQHRRQDARPVPAPAVGPCHPQPQGGHDQAARDRRRDDERSPGADLGRREAVAVPSQVVGVGVADGGQRDDQGDEADGGARVHELDRGSHRPRGARPQRSARLTAGRVGLVHDDLCKVSAPNGAARCAYRACEHSASTALSSDYAMIAPHPITHPSATPGTGPAGRDGQAQDVGASGIRSTTETVMIMLIRRAGRPAGRSAYSAGR